MLSGDVVGCCDEPPGFPLVSVHANLRLSIALALLIILEGQPQFNIGPINVIRIV